MGQEVTCPWHKVEKTALKARGTLGFSRARPSCRLAAIMGLMCVFCDQKHGGNSPLGSGTPSASLPITGSPRELGARRQLAATLARGSAASDETLVQLLRDEDPETLSWAAFGLGARCVGHEQATVQRLVTRAASLSALTLPQDARSTVDRSLALALSRCVSAEAEHSLRAWLEREQPLATEAALGLARLASRRHTLDDGSLVGLLDAAARPEGPIPTALLGIEPLTGLGSSAATRLTDVVNGALKGPGEPRAHAIMALVHGDERASDLLAGIITDPNYTLIERATAARALARRKDQTPARVDQLLHKLAENFATVSTLPNAPWPVLLATLRNLPANYSDKSKRLLRKWATWQITEPLAPFVQHRVTQARCLSASVLAGQDSLNPDLLACDTTGITGELAQLDALDRAPIEGPRSKQWARLLASSQPRVRQAALRLLGGHRELRGASALSDALTDPQAGTVAAAAQLLAAHPDRAQREAPAPGESQVDDQIVASLTRAFERQYGPDQVAVRGALSEAAAALQLLSLKSKIEQLCRDPSTTVRGKAQRALQMLGDRDKTCAAPSSTATTDSPSKEHTKPTVLRFNTSSGSHTIKLRPDIAPTSVQRVLDLVLEGFYNRMAIHRAVPGQVVQFGDPLGDGYGGCGRPPIQSEPSPQHFAAFSVGMADWGKDTASSQLFITLSASPILDGEYTWIGTASSSWENIVLDDMIESVNVEPPSSPASVLIVEPHPSAC